MTKKKHKVLPTEMLDEFKYEIATELGFMGKENYTDSTDIRDLPPRCEKRTDVIYDGAWGEGDDEIRMVNENE